jgi:hypothetical protein
MIFIGLASIRNPKEPYFSDLKVDGVGNAYVTGSTDSTDFPIANALYPSNAGGYDAFALKLSGDGQIVDYSTYFGGSDDDYGYDFAVVGGDIVYVAGYTLSNDFPTVNALYPNFAGGVNDAFVFKLSGDGRSVDYSTYLGGSGYDHIWSIAADSFGNAYVIGSTDSTDFPTANALYPNRKGDFDAFVAKIASDTSPITNPVKYALSTARAYSNVIQVAILSTGPRGLPGGMIDAATVDPFTAYFGPTGTEAPMRYYVYKDFDGDGDKDLVLNFNAGDARFQCWDVWVDGAGLLTAKMYDGQAVAAYTDFRIPPCGLVPRWDVPWQ